MRTMTQIWSSEVKRGDKKGGKVITFYEKGCDVPSYEIKKCGNGLAINETFSSCYFLSEIMFYTRLQQYKVS